MNVTFKDKVNAYSGSKITINNIYFTNRELDIIACLLAGRSNKKIASLLDISDKTVENHVHNVMSKIGHHSREKLIDFIERSNQFNSIKQHYSNLLIRITFEQTLKKIASLLTNIKKTCLIIHSEKQKSNEQLGYKLEKVLKIIGFNIVNNSIENLLLTKNKFHITEPIDYIIYNLTPSFIEQSNTEANILNSAITNLTSIVKTTEI